MKKLKRENAIKLIDNLNKKANGSVVPIGTFVNAYRIIGQQKGLKGEELEAYVQNRIIKSIERTQSNFETDECRGCFSTTRIEDIIRKVTKK